MSTMNTESDTSIETTTNEGNKKTKKKIYKKNTTQKLRVNNEASLLNSKIPQKQEIYGVQVILDFKDGTTWKTNSFHSLVECINNFNTSLKILVEKYKNVYIRGLTIFLNPGFSIVTSDNKDEFDEGGIYNTCSTNKLLEINIGHPNVIINDFQIGGTGVSHMKGSCKFNIINLCAFKPDSRDDTKVIDRYPSISLQNFVWLGALWMDFIYTDLEGVEVTENKWGMKEYTINGIKTSIAPSSKDYPWVKHNTVDMFFMSNVVIKMASPSPLAFPKTIYRVQPLFYLNSFSVVRHQTWASTIYSYVGPTTNGPQIPLTLYNHNFAPSTAHPDYLFNSIKYSAEIYGKFLPICLQLNNCSKCGILNSSLSGKSIITTKALSISGTYMLAVGTENGEPLTEENPVCRVLEFINGPATSNEIQVRPGGIITPSRFVMNGNSIVTSVFKEINQSLYANHSDSVKYLPWIIVNSKGNEDSNMPTPYSKFTSTMFWYLYAPYKPGQITGTSASGSKVEEYGAVTLTNCKQITVHIDYEDDTNVNENKTASENKTTDEDTTASVDSSKESSS